MEFEWDWMLSFEKAHHQYTSMTGKPTESQSLTVNGLVDVQINWQGWTTLLAANGKNIASDDRNDSFDGDLIIQELFWQGSVDYLNTTVDMMFGKVRTDWGVGYGYRPLDIFKPYRRNPIGIQVEEGAGTAMLSYFDSLGEWSLIYSDSSWTQQEGSELQIRQQQQGAGFRRYALTGDTEWQAIAYYDDVRQGLLAGSIVTVLNYSLEWHASALYQRSYLSFQQEETLSPVELQEFDNGYQGLLGINWANSSGLNVIAEYWYDSRSWGQSEWTQALNKSHLLEQEAVTSRLAGSYAQGLNHTNLMVHNLLLHWSLDSSSWSHWDWSRNSQWLDKFEPKMDLLISPEDGGLIATQWFNYQAYDSGSASFNIEVAARLLTGRSSSLYANLSDKHMILLNVKGKF